MKILLVAPQSFYAERGTPISVKLLAETLAEEGNEVDLLCYPFGTDVSCEGVCLIRCRRFPGVSGVGIGWSLAKLLQDLCLTLKLVTQDGRGRYDVVHAVEEAIYPALALRPLHRARVVYDMDSSIADQMVTRLPWLGQLKRVIDACERWSMRRADLVVPMCEALAELAKAVRDPESVVVLHDVPVADSAVPVPAEDLHARSSVGRPLALYVGNLEPYQGIDLLLEAIAYLKDDSEAPKTLVVGGSDQDVARYQRMARERDVANAIEFVGPRPLASLPALLTQADILLSPRVHGGNTPLKIYSYMRSGRPILATNLATHTQVLDASTAFLTPPEPKAFAEGMRALARDPALRSRLGSSARDRVETQFSMDSFRRRLRLGYAQLSEKHLGTVKDV